MQGYNIGLRQQLLQRYEIAPFALLSRRVTTDDLKSPAASISFYQRTYVTYAYNTQSFLVGLPTLSAGKQGQCRCDPLQYTYCITACRCHNLYTPRGAILQVDMVKSYGRSGY